MRVGTQAQGAVKKSPVAAVIGISLGGLLVAAGVAHPVGARLRAILARVVVRRAALRRLRPPKPRRLARKPSGPIEQVTLSQQRKLGLLKNMNTG